MRRFCCILVIAAMTATFVGCDKKETPATTIAVTDDPGKAKGAGAAPPPPPPPPLPGK